MKTNGFKKWLRVRDYSERTIKDYCQIISRVPDLLNYEDLLTYLTELKERLANSTINQRLVVLKKYGEYLKEEGDLVTNYYVSQRIKEVKSYPKVLNLSLLEEMYASYSCSKGHELRDKVLLGLLIYQGSDLGTTKYLERGDIDLERGEIYLSGSERKNRRKLSLRGCQMLPLYRYLECLEGEKLFSTIKLCCVYDRLLKKLQKSHRKVESIRQIRRSVIIHWLKIYNLREVQYYCGHKYISSTEKYVELDLGKLKDALSKYHLLGR